HAAIRSGQLLVVGTSTSEVVGQSIGTAGAEEVAQRIYEGLTNAAGSKGIYVVFQCCEHLNRSIVMEREAADKYGLEPVSVIPVPQAGGSMAAWAYRNMNDPC